jgi:hypothetical protein
MAVRKRAERAFRSTWTRQKEAGKTTEETSACARPECVNQWHDSMIDRI